MIIAASDKTPVQSPAGVGNSGNKTGAAAQDFSAVLSGKVNDRQRQASPAAGTAAGRARSSTAAGGASATVNEPSHPDLLAQKLTARLAGGARDDDAGETPPSAADASTAGESASVTTAQQADPALNSDAAAALMALLALTRPAAAGATVDSGTGIAANATIADGDGIAANATIDNGAGIAASASIDNGAGIAATATTDHGAGGAANATVDIGAGIAANATVAGGVAQSLAQIGGGAGANNAGVGPTIVDARDTVTTTDAGDATAPISGLLAADLPSAKAAGTATPDLKTTTAPATLAAKGKPAPATADSGLATAAAVPVDPAIAAGADSAREGSDLVAATTLILKKTTGILSDVPTAGATAPVIPTLSAADAAVTTTTAPSSALISAQLGSDEWRQAIGQQVLMQMRNGQQNAELRLHPDNLGALQISLQMDGNNQAQIHLVSGHSQVRSALEDALPQLRASLAESGIQLGQSSVGSDATPNWGGTGQDPAGNGRAASGFSIDAITGKASGVPAPASAGTADRAAGIDTFA